MARMFDMQTRRSIRGSLGRFLAILLIAALGCGFYAGLRMTGPDMRMAADAWYDGTHLHDLEVISTLGLTQAQVDMLSQVEGVEAVMPSRSVDAMTTLSGSQYVMRISTLDAAAADSIAFSATIVASGDDAYLNRLVLERGSWPVREGEAVLSADRVMNTSVDVGDVVTVDYGATDLDGVLATREFRVVGLVHSSLYTSDANMGTTSLGSGRIQQYMYVAESNFDAGQPYTEAYLRVAGADAHLAGSDAYQACVDETAARVEAEAPDIARNRLDEVRADAQRELDEARAEYGDAEREADGKLAGARRQLDDAQAEIDAGQARLDAAAAQIAEGQRQLDAGAAELDGKAAEADAAAEGWAARRSELEEAAAQAQAAKEQAESHLPEAQAAKEQADAGLQQVDAGIAALQARLSDLRAQRAAAAGAGDDAAVAALDAAIASLEGADPATAADPNLASLSAQRSQVAQGAAAAEAALAEVQGGIRQAESGIRQAQEGIAQGDAAVSDAKERIRAARGELASRRSQLEEARAEYEEGMDQLARARSQLADGRREYGEQEADVQRELARARAELENAQDGIDALELPEVYVLDRTKNFGVQSVQADSERIDNIASVFPFVFFLVAALVSLTTMTRMVDEERQLIGTFKALGYSKRRIIGKYLRYAGLASATGAALGIAVLAQVLPGTIQNAYAIIYNVPQPSGPLAYDVPLTLLAGLLGVGITLVATWAAAARTLREAPAALMLPPAPAPGKRILLERVGPLWRRLSFSWKVTFRNLFRYKKRFWMTVIGLAGCTALLLTGFGLHNAIWDIIDKQYGPIIAYNVQVDLDDGAGADEADAVERILRDTGHATAYARAQTVNMQVGTGSAQDETRGVTVTVPRNPADFTRLVDMRVRETQAAIPFDDRSVVVTEKLARLLGVGVGDSIELFDQDSIGNATGAAHALVVTGVMENYVGDQLYLGKDAFQDMTGAASRWNALFADTDPGVRGDLNAGLMAAAGVQTVAFNDETIDTYRTMLQSVNIIVVVLVVAAALLSFIVLYNLININITERRREMASLKVLGFTPREVNAYVFREVLLLTLIGAAIGLVLGVFLEGFVVSTAEVDYVMFGRDIHAWSFAAAFALTLVFTCVVMFFMRAKLAAIDMVESLKSVE